MYKFLLTLFASILFASSAFAQNLRANGADVSDTNPLPAANRAYTTVIQYAPTINAGAYTTGMLVGGKITLANAVRSSTLSGVIAGITITDLGKQSANIDVIFFNADPSGTTFTDHAVLTVADADLPKIVCAVNLTVHTTFNDNSVSSLTNINCPVTLAATSLYAAIIVRASATFGSTDAIRANIGILQD